MDKKDLLKTIRERFKVMQEAESTNRRMAMEDYKFVNEPGYQWEEQVKKERGDRPCYEFNKLRQSCKHVINNMRANTPQGKVRGVEGGDKQIAEIYEGLIRNIWNQSDADTAIDYASEYQVSAGIGSWRISTKYVSNDVFEQDIVIETIANPFCLYADPAAKDMLKVDARDWILTERISKTAYEKRWPKADVTEFEAEEFDDDEDWHTDDEVRIAEYWYKEASTKEIWQLEDGTIINADSEEGQIIEQTMPDVIKRRRTVNYDKIMMCIASGDAILEGPTEWAGSMFPFVQIYGEYAVIDGKLVWHGLPRFAKDAQRSYNASRTAITETIALAPQAKWWATADQAKGHVDRWADAHKQNYPFMLFNSDPKQPGAPQRMGGPDVPVALIQESQIASDEIKAVTGIFDASLGAQSNETSGRAIYARQQQGQISTFNYEDNRAKGIKRTWDLLVDLIPKVYDTERELRVLGSDGIEDYKRVNRVVLDGMGNEVKVNDLSMGRYDVTVTIGPSFTTRRQEASEIYGQMMQSNPEIFGIAGDLIFKSMDLPYAEDIADRLQVMLPPQIQQMLNSEQEVPPEVQMMMQQAQQAMAQVEEQAAMMQQQYAELEQKNSESELTKVEIEKMLANLDKQKAQFEAFVAKEVSKIMEKYHNIEMTSIQMDKEAEGDEQKENEVEQIKDAMNMQLFAEISRSMEAITVATQQIAMMNVKPSRIQMVRENGVTTAVPVYDEPLQ